MPIQTNCALETAFFHMPIPATKTEVRRLNAVWNRQPPKNGRIVATHTKRGMTLKVKKPVVMVAVADEYWRALGRLVKRTGEPWWDICAVVLDSEAQPKKPQAHALSLYRITAQGKLNYLVSEEPESLWPEAYASRPKRQPAHRTTAKRRKRWQFAPDLIGFVTGPKNLSMRKGFARR